MKNDKEKISLTDDIKMLASSMQQLTCDAYDAYKPLVDDIVQSNNKDMQEIEHILDGLLGFAYDDKILLLYKKLCRHYFYIDPQSTAYYIESYQEMWDSEDAKEGK